MLYGLRRHDGALAALFHNHSEGFFNRALVLHREAKAKTCLRSPKMNPEPAFQDDGSAMLAHVLEMVGESVYYEVR